MKMFFQTGEAANAQVVARTANSNLTGDTAAWKQIVAKYQQPSRWRGVWQIIDSLVPLAVLWYLIYLTLPVSWWIVLPLAMLAGGFLVRLFIIHHDCGHG